MQMSKSTLCFQCVLNVKRIRKGGKKKKKRKIPERLFGVLPHVLSDQKDWDVKLITKQKKGRKLLSSKTRQ